MSIEPIEVGTQTELARADAFLPRFDWDDDKKRKYLSFRLCGFSRQESQDHAGIARKTIYNWINTDESFKDIEHRNLVEIRSAFSKEVLTLEFTRNFRMALEKDARVLQRALESDFKPLTRDESEYLAKIRSLYTPKALQELEGFFKDASNSDMGFDELILIARKYNNTNGNQES